MSVTIKSEGYVMDVVVRVVVLLCSLLVTTKDMHRLKKKVVMVVLFSIIANFLAHTYVQCFIC
jgi:hypothetical protein